MTAHWTIDGIPACNSPLTLLSIHLPPNSTACSFPTVDEARAAMEGCRDFYADHGFTDFDFQVVEGGCGQPNSQTTYEAQTYREAYEAGIRKAVALSPDPKALEQKLVELEILPSPEDIAQAKAREEAEEEAHEKQTQAKKAVEERLRD